MDIQKLLKQAQKMQKDIANAESELKEKAYETTVGGGAVKVIANGMFEITELTISSELQKDDIEMLQDMIIMAVNEVIAKAVKEKDEVMNEMTAGVKFPGV